MEECRCVIGEHCQKYNRRVSKNMWNLCHGLEPSGKPMGREKQHKLLSMLERHGSGKSSEPAKPATPEQFPCIFREGVLEEVPCQSCGQRDKTAMVYTCGLHGKCTVGSHGVTHDGTNATQRVKVCISCDDRNEVG